METVKVSLDMLSKILNVSKTEMLDKYFISDGDNGYTEKQQSDVDSQFSKDVSRHVEAQRSAKESDGTRAGKRIAFEEVEGYLKDSFGIEASGNPGGWKDQLKSAVDSAKEIEDIPSEEKVKASPAYAELRESMQALVDTAQSELKGLKESQRLESVATAKQALIESIISDAELNLNVHEGESEDDKKRRSDHIRAFALLLENEGISLEPHPDHPKTLIPMKDGKQLENEQFHAVTGKNYVSQKALSFFGQRAGERTAPPMGPKPGDASDPPGTNDFSNIVDLASYNAALDKAINEDKPAEYIQSMEKHYETVKE